MPVAVTQIYCIGCRRKHRGQFYRKDLDDDEPYAYCKDTLNKLTYQKEVAPHELFHPAWGRIKEALGQSDSTDHPIHSLRLRADLQALKSQDAELQNSSTAWRTLVHRIYFCLYAFSLYWSRPMSSLWREVKLETPSQMTKTLWTNAGKKITSEFSNLRIRGNILLYRQRTGLMILRNPSSRDGAMEDFARYCSDTPAILKVSQEIAKALTPLPRQVELGTILGAMARGKSSALTGSNDYRNVRVARAVVFMLGLRPADTEADWVYLRSMSDSISSKTKNLGIWTSGNAIKMRDAIRTRLAT